MEFWADLNAVLYSWVVLLLIYYVSEEKLPVFLQEALLYSLIPLVVGS